MVLTMFADNGENNCTFRLPTQVEWTTLSQLIMLLRPFEEATRHLSSTNSCMSQCIPTMFALKKMLNEKMGTLSVTKVCNVVEIM